MMFLIKPPTKSSCFEARGDAIAGMVLAVPWSWQPNNAFAQEAAQIWRGRISWRTTTAYDATDALATALSQNPTRTGVYQQLNQGIPISGTAQDFWLTFSRMNCTLLVSDEKSSLDTKIIDFCWFALLREDEILSVLSAHV